MYRRPQNPNKIDMTTLEIVLIITYLIAVAYVIVSRFHIKNLKEQIKIREDIEKNDKDYIKKLELRIKDLKTN